jgi:hypothetical protein
MGIGEWDGPKLMKRGNASAAVRQAQVWPLLSLALCGFIDIISVFYPDLP